MEKKRKILNTVMVLAIVLIIGFGVAIVGNIRGWFASDDEVANARIVVSEKIGNANIERAGVGYTLKEDTALNTGDIIETLQGSSLRLEIDKDNQLLVNEKTEISIKQAEKGKIMLEILQGEIYVDSKTEYSQEDYAGIAFNGKEALISNNVFSVSAVKGTETLTNFDGDLTYIVDGEEKSLSKGKMISFIQSKKGVELSEGKIMVNGLNQFTMDQVKNSNKKRELAVTNDDIEKVIAQREKEQRETQAALSANDAAIIEAGNDQKVETTEEGNMPNLDNSSKKVYTANITIRCDTILDNMKLLTPGKGKFVPPNGVILSTSTVQFYEGETVFDVLKRVCDYANIQLEYSYTPLYGSYYIEGINHLYEFDCGEPGNNQSGWMYKVNGWFPNYGCSAYELKNGDNIVWCYTCKGLGEDVGSTFMQ